MRAERAGKSLEVARRMVALRTRVLSHGKVVEIPFESLVVGDILDLQLESHGKGWVSQASRLFSASVSIN